MSILVIQKKGQSDWKSCQAITSNLHQSYELMGKSIDGEVKTFTIAESITDYEGLSLAHEILELKPKALSFIDHHPHPAPLIRSLKRVYERNKAQAPMLVFHIFGDFVLNCLQWKSIEEELKFFKVQFVSASHKQARLLDSFCRDDRAEVIPFPISDLDYFFSEEVRDKCREKYKLGNEFVFLYTGRLSYQKNITTLLRSFSTFVKNFEQRARLVIAGPMDDLAIPYLGKEALPGTFFFHWEESLLEYGLEEKVLYLGDLNKEELFELYNGADCYISLSTHNDEDYGMSPAEALGTGLPCVLSQWGGFISFAHYFPAMVNLVEVERQRERNLPQVQSAFKFMASQFIQGEDLKERKVSSLNIHDILGIHAISKRLGPLCNPLNRSTFQGFNALFSKLCAQFENNPQSPFRAANGGYGTFYEQVYGDYSKRDIGRDR